jgi:hypothetical protein
LVAQHEKQQPQVVQVKTEVVPEKIEVVSAKTDVLPEKTVVVEERPKVVPAEPEAGSDPKDVAETQTQPAKDAKVISGMSILGNQEAPTSLVIVPWKSSELNDSPGISPMLDDSREPVDKEVFMRALRYYEIRSEKKP